MPIDFPWKDLGLTHAWIDASNECVLYDFEKSKPISETSQHQVAIRVAYSADGPTASSESTLDLRLLAKALLPTLSEHGPDAVYAHYNLSMSGSEVDTLAGLLQALLTEALRLDRELVALLGRLLPSPISDVLARILVFPKLPEPVAEPVGDVEDAHALPIVALTIDDAFSPNGRIAAAFGSFERRCGQLAMAKAVEAAFQNGHAALVEAGPGTGKTFAYLIPAILHLQQQRSDRVIISTRTRQLQEQLFGKDLPFLIQRIAPDLEVALLKGRENYICLRRWHALIGELAESLEKDVLLPLLAPLARWMAETETGDIEENSAFQSDPECRSLWRRLSDSPHHCTGVFCPFIEDCFSVLARRRARRADLVVVNHSLLLGDLAVGGVVLGKYTHLVLDEAHTLEATSRMAFTQQLTERAFVRLADDLAPEARRRRGWLQRTPFEGGKEPARRIEDLLSHLRAQVRRVFRQFAQHLSDERRAAFTTLTELSEDIGETPLLLSQLEGALDSLADHIEDEEPLKELEGYIRIVQGLKDVVSAMSSPPAENTVHWYERSPHSLMFQATPLDVAPFLERLLYPKLKALVLTSATLSLAGTFDYLCRSLGLSDDVFPIQSMIADSPFAYEDRMRILVPRDIPPAHGELTPYAEAVAGLIAALSNEVGKNGLALFTSYAMMQAVSEKLPSSVRALVQGEQSRTALIDRFRSGERPMWLLGTESFWEGVDFPGDELEVLVITRLPFPVPTDPVLAAMGERMMRSGRDPFMDLSLPLAGLKLRQGVGRLIRTTEDRGLVFLADQRIVTRGYGRLLAASLPVKIEAVPNSSELMSEANDWFRHIDG